MTLLRLRRTARIGTRFRSVQSCSSSRVLAAALATLCLWTAAEAQTPAPRSGSQPSTGGVPQPRQVKVFPIGSSWTAVSLNGKPFSGERPSFTLDQQFRARGFAGCNTYSATAYPLREQGFAVGPFVLTKKSCDRGVMQSEQAFLVALRTAAKWDLEGASLVIKGQNGDLRFDRAM
jgi:heat shock protein HslJ